jgi:hypothetical protein
VGFDKGASAIEQQEERDAEARKAAYSSDRLSYLTIDPGDTVYIRLLTPASEWIGVRQHSFVKTKPAPKDAPRWPKSMGAVCRYDPQIQSILGNDGCYICDNKLQSGFRDEFAKPSSRSWALAVMRHQVRGDGTPEMGGKELQGKLIGYDDVYEEYEPLDDEGKPSGVKRQRLKIVIINQTWSNFFATFKNAEDNYASGALGRDFHIRRIGEKKETEYHLLAADPIRDANGKETLNPSTPAWKRYTDALAERKIDLEQLVLGQASDEYYAKWFDVTKQVDKDGKIVPVDGATISETSAQVFTGEYPPAPNDEPLTESQQDAMARMRERLTGNAS